MDANPTEPVNDAQIEFGKKIGLNLSGKSIGVAKAIIEDAFDIQFNGINDLGQPSIKQQAFALKYGHDISTSTKRVGNAVIDDIMQMLNVQAISKYGLAPGVAVIKNNDILQRVWIISSINNNGTVYFRGGNGAKAWARSLKKAS